MRKHTNWMVSFLFLLIGFMVAVQFQTTTTVPGDRDTRDQWEVREALKIQQEKQHELLSNISKADQTIEDYELKSSQEQMESIKDSIELLESQVGLQKVKGSGVVIEILPIFQESQSGQAFPSISPQLLSRLLNELNTYGATDIAVGNERITSLTPIRNVNGHTYVNNRPISSLPVEIKVLSENPEKLLDYIEVSESRDSFNIENMNLKIEMKSPLTLPEYDDPLHLEIFEGTGE